jgi:hypothetical protein
VDSAGQTLPDWDPVGGSLQFVARGRVNSEGAQINHYMSGARDSFELKRGAPSSAQLVDRYNDNYLKWYDRNEVSDVSALAYAPRFDPVHAQAMALPGVRRLHHLCCADYVAALGAKLGFEPQADPRWRHHMAEAARAG